MATYETIALMLMAELENVPVFYSIPYTITDDDTVLYTTLFNFYNDEKPSVINDDELSKLIKSKIKYTKKNDINNDYLNTLCPITQVDFIDQQDIIILECKHCFDPEAILYWLKEEKAECPVCRHNCF